MELGRGTLAISRRIEPGEWALVVANARQARVESEDIRTCARELVNDFREALERNRKLVEEIRTCHVQPVEGAIQL